jgi:hypothetical protein
MNRQALLDECEALHARNFAEPGDRDRFDELMLQIEAIDRAQPPMSTRIAGGAPGPRPGGGSAPAPALATGASPATEPTPRHRNPAAPARQREALDDQLAMLERADLPSYQACITFGGAAHSLSSVRRQLPNLPPAFLADVQLQANALEDQVFARDARRDADAARQARLDAARATELSDDEQAEQRQILDEARAAGETTHEQRVERLLQDIANRLEARQ